jgi:hypothetical protein
VFPFLRPFKQTGSPGPGLRRESGEPEHDHSADIIMNAAAQGAGCSIATSPVQDEMPNAQSWVASIFAKD